MKRRILILQGILILAAAPIFAQSKSKWEEAQDRWRAAEIRKIKLDLCSKLKMVADRDAGLITLEERNTCWRVGVDLERKLSAEKVAAWAKTKAGKICAAHADWPREACQVVADRTLKIGMTAEQVRASLGKPQQMSRTMSADEGESEEWTYGTTAIRAIDGYRDSALRITRLSFDNGILKSFREIQR